MHYHGMSGKCHAAGRQAGVVSRGHVMEALAGILKKRGLFCPLKVKKWKVFKQELKSDVCFRRVQIGKEKDHVRSSHQIKDLSSCQGSWGALSSAEGMS